jgi:UDP-glucuronate 4-epimerase
LKKILVTGAAGFIGSHLIEALLKRGDAVTGVDNFDTYYDPSVKRVNLLPARRHDAFTFHEADICDADRMASILEERAPDVIVHLAARAGVRPSIEDPALYYRVNVDGTRVVLDAALEQGVGHLVLASSSSVYSGSTRLPYREDEPADRPLSPYAATKRAMELLGHTYAHLHGMNLTLLRFFTAYGPRQRPDMAIHKFARLIDSGQAIPMFGSGDSLRDYTYIGDIVDGVVRAVDRPFPYEIINLGAGETNDLRTMIRVLADAMGKMAVIDEQPSQPGDAPATHADVSRARDLLGYAPSVSLDEGIRNFVAWYRERQADGSLGQATAG